MSDDFHLQVIDAAREILGNAIAVTSEINRELIKEYTKYQRAARLGDSDVYKCAIYDWRSGKKREFGGESPEAVINQIRNIPYELAEALMSSFQCIRTHLEEYKAKSLPSGTEVTVKCDRYDGPGVVVSEDDCPIQQVAVKLPNGNTWWYDVNQVTPKKGGTP